MNRRQKLVQQQYLNNEEAVIKRLKQVYNQSLKDVNDKVKNLEFQIGSLTEEYDWLDDDDPQKEIMRSRIQSKIYQKQYQEALQGQLDEIMQKMQTKQFLTVSDYLDECYTDGFVGTVFDQHGQGVPLIMPIDQEAMVRAIQLDSKISQGLYTRLGEDVGVLKKRITSEVTRSIATGASYAQAAKRLSNQTNIGFNRAVRIARTEGHRIQTTAAMDAMYAAKEKGADVIKQWDATLDDVTRESHRQVDGQIRELDEDFGNGLEFPGDPAGGAAEVINCRCALLQRARWALDEDELQTLKDRAAYFGLDKSEEFEDFKKKYLKAVEEPSVVDQKHKSASKNTNKSQSTLENSAKRAIIKVKNSDLANGLPITGVANSIVDKTDNAGNIEQRRIYGADGRAQMDFDTSNHNQPKQHPTGAHKHIFDYSKKRPRSKPVPLTDKELADNQDIIQKGVNYHDEG